ncbi:hypothetical protein ACJX0J_027334, partial [Zea mays]
KNITDLMEGLVERIRALSFQSIESSRLMFSATMLLYLDTAAIMNWRPRINGLLGNINANTGDPQVGWDIDQFMTDIAEATLVMSSVVKNGGLAPGGFNFDAKLSVPFVIFCSSKIALVRFVIDKRTGGSHGFCHVDFQDDEALEIAIVLDQSKLEGFPLLGPTEADWEYQIAGPGSSSIEKSFSSTVLNFVLAFVMDFV